MMLNISGLICPEHFAPEVGKFVATVAGNETFSS